LKAVVRLHFNEVNRGADASIVRKNYPPRGQVADLGDALTVAQAAEWARCYFGSMA
jgi:hypothetical protein